MPYTQNIGAHSEHAVLCVPALFVHGFSEIQTEGFLRSNIAEEHAISQ